MSDSPPGPAARIQRGTGRSRITLDAYGVGPDLLVVLHGSGPHLGAVTLAEPRPGTDEIRSGTLGALRHREPDLTAGIARRLARVTDRRVVVTGGIHIDDARPDEIRDVLRNAEKAAEELFSHLGPGHSDRDRSPRGRGARTTGRR